MATVKINYTGILKQAIEKAIANGWKKPKYLPRIKIELLVIDMLDGIPYVNTVIFDPSFAKALWGEKQGFNGVPVEAVLKMAVSPKETLSSNMKTVGDIFSIKSEPIWQYHLQQMVMADDPIKYLGDHI